MYRPCLHCNKKNVDNFNSEFCPTGCEYGWDKTELKKYETIGDYDRLRALAEADRDGRCVVLPCKVGDTVYVRQAAVGFGYELDKYKEEILIGKITSFRVTETRRFMRIKFRTTKNGRAQFRRFYFASIGKTVFLTPEEAEAALGGEEKCHT